ncbi:D-alanyl-D-alanine carboxypeptidase/D-alanyl-D-alanine-endopeptidase [Sphingomonas parva]|uniref:D-alanyl-D-alanine carboxypeptidase/D-alanyl-D-alanine-endopeptidase n=1 Tax=Sphingomonas parva TaxID=2555898 RepID=A0A4Y8ZX58_9SPHN|nr:D-alanyl-D-alanine carboxypeptidase/D-alanyl-D-alanine-endopeptidase [Sphingomonas parva]TFI60077.1 D-alanyl-D-alanine carboxypeptidase/D-alanyl-D-alanine-endopeptidase [Sphingomonas parva]
MTRTGRSARLALLLLVAAASPALSQQPLRQRVEARLAESGPGLRFGLLVTDESGRELVAINPDERFIPASNTKIFTTAAAFATLDGLDQPDRSGGASVRLERPGRGDPDVVLTGHGDARLSSAADCASNCLAALADAVAAATRRVDDVIGDDSLFPDQRWSPGMSWNNIVSRYGTGISALTVDDNELAIRIVPGAMAGPPRLELLPYYDVDNRAVTVAGGASNLSVDRMPGSRLLRLSGTIGADAAAETLRVGVDDPAHFAAWRLRSLLEARGVRVAGKVDVRHRPVGAADDPKHRNGAPPPRPPRPEPLAELTPSPLEQDLVRINKESQNLHAELMMRRLGLVNGTGSIPDGVAAVGAMMERAGAPRTGWDLSDGSGMSTYNRMAPRAVVGLLRWISAQPWGGRWRATLPVGGVDGTLARRFRGTALEGKIFAKTGSINATNALSGYLVANSGRTLTFSSFANDVPEDVAATRAIDAALELIAAEN